MDPSAEPGFEVPIRRPRTPRCAGCGLTFRLCVCASLPRARVATRFAVVRHTREEAKPTNTARLLERMIEGAEILPWGQGEPSALPALLADPSTEWKLLFPRGNAPVLDAGMIPAGGRRLGLVLLDGSWRQCTRMSRRLPSIERLPFVQLPPGPPSFWTLRSQHLEGGRSTFEAVLHAIEILEGPAAAVPLRRAFALVTARFLFLRGRLRRPEIPADWPV